MSTDRDTARIVRSWLEEGVTALPDRVLDAVLDQVPTTRQRRSLWRRLAYDGDRSFAALAAAAASIVVVVLVGLAFVPGLAPGGGATPAPPSPRPSPTVEASPTEPVETLLPPGRYSLQGYPIGVSFTVPSGWLWCITNQYEQGVCRRGANGGVQFLIVDNVVEDPCFETLRDPPVGPSVDDLVTALSGLSRFTATTPVDITVDGYAGKEFTLTAPSVPGCTMRTWATPERINGVGLNEANLMRIVDVQGTRVVIAAPYPRLALDADEAIALARQIMDSVTFTP